MVKRNVGFSVSSLTAGLLVLGLIGAIGCGQSAGIRPVEVDVDEITEQFLAEYDKNHDGQLSRDEQQAVPPLADRGSRFDADSDGTITTEELKDNLGRIFDWRAGMLSGVCTVLRNGQPLANAEVRFVPVPCLREVVPSASGVTNSDGVAMLSLAPDELPDDAPKVPGLIRPGLYLLEITHGTISIPEKYNRQTTLGKEISIDTTAGPTITIDLKI